MVLSGAVSIAQLESNFGAVGVCERLLADMPALELLMSEMKVEPSALLARTICSHMELNAAGPAEPPAHLSLSCHRRGLTSKQSEDSAARCYL